MRILVSLWFVTLMLLNVNCVYAEGDSGTKNYAVTVLHNNKENLTDKLVFDGNTVQLGTLSKLGYPSVEVTTSKVRDFVRLKLKSGDKDLKTFHAVLNADGSVEGSFAMFDAKRNKQSYQFKGTLEK